MVTLSTLATIFEFIKKCVPSEVLAVVGDQLQGVWRQMFANVNLLVLGPKEAGKSSLIYLMMYGKPFIVGEDGEKKSPDPTAGIVGLNKKIKLDKNEWFKLKADVAGDVGLRYLWKTLIDDINPHGIVYILNGQKMMKPEVDPAAVGQLMDELFVDVLAYYTNSARNLRALAICLNFSDRWAKTPINERSLVHAVTDAFELKRKDYDTLQHLRLSVSTTQLHPTVKKWAEAERALKRLAADLSEGK